MFSAQQPAADQVRWCEVGAEELFTSWLVKVLFQEQLTLLWLGARPWPIGRLLHAEEHLKYLEPALSVSC